MKFEVNKGVINMTNEEQRLIYECFNTHINGSFRDLIAELEGQHELADKDEVVDRFAEELKDYNENERGSVYVDNIDYHEAAIDEFLERARLDYYDDGIYWLKSEELIDEERNRVVNMWDGIVF